MAFLTAILTHLSDEVIRAQLDYLRALSPDSRFAVCFGGTRAEYERLALDDVLFADDPSLHGAPRDRSHVGVLRSLWEQRVRHDPEIGLVYFVEFDHLILRSDFERRLSGLADGTGAGMLAKSASPRNDTNWPHYLRHRHDERANAFFARISRRDDHRLRFGCLGSGMLFRREALEAFCAIPDHPPLYVELLVPTVVHHLGFDVADVDQHSDLYAAVGWRPERGLDDAIAAKRAGRTFLHPFKRLDLLQAVAAA